MTWPPNGWSSGSRNPNATAMPLTVIVVSLVVGVGAQTGFVSFGADDWIQSKVGNLFD